MRRNNDNEMMVLASTASVINTLSGGISQPSVNSYQEQDGTIIKIRVPGFFSGSLKVEINNNRLMVLQLLEIPTTQSLITVPRVILNEAIAYYIEVDNITASCEEGNLVIRLPFNGKSNGYRRTIKIKQR